MPYGTNTSDLKIGTTTTTAAAGDKGVSNGDSHDHDGGDGATVPVAGGGTGSTTAAAARTALGTVAEPVSISDALGGSVLFDSSGLLVSGVNDTLTGGSLDAAWTEIFNEGGGHSNQTITPDSGGLILDDQATAASGGMGISIPLIRLPTEVRLFVSLSAAPATTQLSLRMNADDSKFFQTLIVFDGAWKFGIRQNAGATTSSAVGDSTFWIGWRYFPANGRLVGYHDATTAGSADPGFPTDSGGSWTRFGTEVTVAAADMLINPVLTVIMTKTHDNQATAEIRCASTGLARY